MSSVTHISYGLSIIRDTLEIIKYYFGDKYFGMRLLMFIKLRICLFHKNYSMFDQRYTYEAKNCDLELSVEWF